MIDRAFALDFVRVTESAAIAAARWIGRGDKKAADKAAVDEMRDRFNQIDFSGTVVIGEGKKDEAPELYVGETLGRGGHEIAIAVDPLECTDSVAHGRPNALSVIVTGERDSLLSAPDTYMQKIAVGKEASRVIDLDAPVKVNVQKTAKALGKDLRELSVVVLDRDRHAEIIQQIRAAGARVTLITDGDVAGAIAAAEPNTEIDMLLGTGASAEAVLAAAAVKVLDGELLARFAPRHKEDEQAISDCGITDQHAILTAEDMAKGDSVSFTATGVIGGPLLPGVVFTAEDIITHSVVMRACTKTVRFITTYHKHT